MASRGSSPYKSLYLQVLVAVAAGVAIGHFWPTTGIALKPLADGFIRLIKVLVAPVVFTTVVLGIGKVGDLSRVGRVGVKALIYFEAATTLALVIGLGVAALIRPGEGLPAHAAVAAPPSTEVRHDNAVDFALGLIPTSLVSPFVSGDILQVLVLAILTGMAITRLGPAADKAHDVLELGMKLLFEMVAWVMKLAPLAALGAMAFTVGQYGLGTLAALGKLVAGFYATALLFVLVVLGSVMRALGLRILPLLRYIKDELLLVLGTSSSEAALPRILEKLENLGCAPHVVRLVVPLGYSFNLDGTSIYLTLGSIFVAQATGTHLTWGEQLALLGVLLLTSKGAAAVTGGGFITLQATLAATGKIPVSGLTLLLGVDRFMSEARALTNLVGNTVATRVVSRWENALDVERARRVPERRGSTP